MSASEYQVNFHGTNLEIIFKAIFYLIGQNLTLPIVQEISAKCFSADILEALEINKIKDGNDLATLISTRTPTQKANFIQIVCSYDSHTIFRTAVDVAIKKELRKIPVSSVQIEQQETRSIPTEETISISVQEELQSSGDSERNSNNSCTSPTHSIDHWKRILGFSSNYKKAILIMIILGLVLVVTIIGIFSIFSSEPNYPTQTPIFLSTNVSTMPSIPEEVTESHPSVYPKILKPDSTNLSLSFDPPPIKSIIHIDSLNGASNYKTACKKGSSTALHLKSEEMLTPSSNPVDIPCPENVHSLELSGISSIQYLHQVLSLLINLRGIVINATYLCNLEMSSELTTSFIKLKFLDSLKLTNMQGECDSFLEYLNTTFNAPNLQRLDLENVEIIMDNIDQFQNFFKKIPTVQYFTFYGRLCYNCVIDSFWTNLTGLKWFVHEDVGTSGLDSLKSFVKSPSLQVVQTNVKIGRYLDFFPYSDKLLSLNLTIDLGSNDFDSKFFSQFPNLQEAELKLLASSSDRTINLESLQKYVRKMRSLKFSSKNHITHIGFQTLPCVDFAYDGDGDERIVLITAMKDSSQLLKHSCDKVN